MSVSYLSLKSTLLNIPKNTKKYRQSAASYSHRYIHAVKRIEDVTTLATEEIIQSLGGTYSTFTYQLVVGIVLGSNEEPRLQSQIPETPVRTRSLACTTRTVHVKKKKSAYIPLQHDNIIDLL